MSTASNLQIAPEDLPPPENPYYYGSRLVRRRLPDGTEIKELVPLTRQDVLHPQEGDYIVESDLHDLLCGYLADVFRARLAEVPGALVLSNTGVYWDKPELRHHAPDACVIFGVKEKRSEWRSFDVAEQGTRPSLIIELVSPHVRKNDLEDKFEDYHTAEVPCYIIVDRHRLGGDWNLLGYLYTPAGYLPMPTDARGWLWLDAVKVWLGVDGQRVICYDQNGSPIGDYTEITRQLEAEKARAESEKARADVAEQRAQELEAELARLRGQNPPPA